MRLKKSKTSLTLLELSHQPTRFSEGGWKANQGYGHVGTAPGVEDRGGTARLPLEFRDWAAEETDHPREVAEAALAHKVRNPIEAACQRTDLFERRRRLMDNWADYLDQLKAVST